jgi:hypothetical protein
MKKLYKLNKIYKRSIKKNTLNFTFIAKKFVSKIKDKLNFTRGDMVRRTTYSTTNITQTTTVPVLLILTDTTVENYLNYGVSWTLITTINDNSSNNWLSISLSSDGRYQTAIDEKGTIYVTNDYGTTWTSETNIGNSPANSVSISFTGIYQTISNGTDIYITNLL